MNFSGVITIDRSDAHANGQGQRSEVKVTKVEIIFAQIWLFPDRDSSLNSQMAVKCWTKFEVTKKRYLIVFLGHPSNFKVIRAEKSMIWSFEFNLSKITRSVTAIKSLRFALFKK